MQHEQFVVHADIEDRHWWFTGRREIMEAVVHAVVPPSKEKTVTDIGCGTGANIAGLASEYSCVGIDPTPDAIAFAKERFPGVQFVCGFAPQDLTDEQKHADVYLLMDVLEHIEDDYGFLKNLVMAMKPGARLYLAVPANMSLWTEHDVSFGHFRRYDAKTLSAVWAELPVDVELLSSYNTRLYPIVKIARMFSRRRKKSLGREGTDLAMPPAPANWVLRRIFAGEARRLVCALRGTAKPYVRGVSLVAVLRRT